MGGQLVAVVASHLPKLAVGPLLDFGDKATATRSDHGYDRHASGKEDAHRADETLGQGPPTHASQLLSLTQRRNGMKITMNID